MAAIDVHKLENNIIEDRLQPFRCSCGQRFTIYGSWAAHADVESCFSTPNAPKGLPDLHQYVPGHPYGAPISKEELLEYRKQLFAKLDGVLLAKGNDYNAAQQDAGDTLFNLRTAAILGVVPTPEDGILVRLSDKLMRLVSLTRPGTVQKVKDESIEDTGGDAINYITYLLAMIAKKRGKL